jgi:hypothetical protein
MAIANYTDLQGAVADYLARADLTARIPDFIKLAEAHFNRELRTREMVAGVFTALDVNYVLALPSDFVEWISAQWIGSAGSADLRYAEMDSEAWRFRYRPNGHPSMFTIAGTQLLIRPLAAGNINLKYYQGISPLVDASTNWLLTKCPDLYLYRTLAEAYIFQKNETRAAEFLTLAGAETTKAITAADSNKLAKRPNSPPPGDDTGTA